MGVGKKQNDSFWSSVSAGEAEEKTDEVKSVDFAWAPALFLEWSSWFDGRISGSDGLS